MMTAYLDDSSNGRSIFCGGWIAFDRVWDEIIKKWLERISYESRVSVKRGLKPLSRYHAADCASCQGEFQGWTVERQILMVKKLQDIMVCGNPKTTSHHKPMIFGWGANVTEARQLLPEATDKQLKQLCYKMSVGSCLKEIAEVMSEYYTNEKITIIHDRGKTAAWAKEAFDSLHEKESKFRHQFVSITSMGWEGCVPLQCSDMVAYDLMRRIDTMFFGPDEVRKSLERICRPEHRYSCRMLQAGGICTIAGIVGSR